MAEAKQVLDVKLKAMEQGRYKWYKNAIFLSSSLTNNIFIFMHAAALLPSSNNAPSYYVYENKTFPILLNPPAILSSSSNSRWIFKKSQTHSRRTIWFSQSATTNSPGPLKSQRSITITTASSLLGTSRMQSFKKKSSFLSLTSTLGKLSKSTGLWMKLRWTEYSELLKIPGIFRIKWRGRKNGRLIGKKRQRKSKRIRWRSLSLRKARELAIRARRLPLQSRKKWKSKLRQSLTNSQNNKLRKFHSKKAQATMPIMRPIMRPTTRWAMNKIPAFVLSALSSCSKKKCLQSLQWSTNWNLKTRNNTSNRTHTSANPKIMRMTTNQSLIFRSWVISSSKSWFPSKTIRMNTKRKSSNRTWRRHKSISKSTTKS